MTGMLASQRGGACVSLICKSNSAGGRRTTRHTVRQRHGVQNRVAKRLVQGAAHPNAVLTRVLATRQPV
jgi:hypothetical protein